MDNNDNNVVEDTVMDLDLNQEPSEPPSTEPVGGLGTLLDELETAHDQIEERIRRLEAVTARARLRQRWRQLHNQTPHETDVTLVPDDVACGKRNSSHLVTTNLDIVDGKTGFFDCNICLDMAREPILTCCGHLFCWACFFRLPNLYPAAKECPVCKGEVSEKNVTPIYGNGKNALVMETNDGVVIPPRPQAQRVQSIRQRRAFRVATHIPVSEALRRIRMGINGEDRPQLRRGDGRWRLRTHEFSSVLPDNANSLYNISSALDNAERLVDDLESFVNGRLPGNNDSNASSSQPPRESTAAATEDRSSSSSRIRVQLSADPDNVVSRELRRRRLG